MNILILGYGKMGKAIEALALERGHHIVHQITSQNRQLLDQLDPATVDVAIEFSQPEAAYENLKYCMKHQIPVVCGTTGWLEHMEEIHSLCKQNNGTFFYASNFSIGVNLFFKLNEMLARLMNNRPEYAVEMEEIHHIHKKDAPSGTAITLAEGIIENLKRKDKWEMGEEIDENSIKIHAVRENEVPGTHSVTYSSEIDSLEIKHTAHTRKGFALGALLAAEWAKDKKGVLSMDEFLKL